jgi:hypothetical protein
LSGRRPDDSPPGTAGQRRPASTFSAVSAWACMVNSLLISSIS